MLIAKRPGLIPGEQRDLRALPKSIHPFCRVHTASRSKEYLTAFNSLANVCLIKCYNNVERVNQESVGTNHRKPSSGVLDSIHIRQRTDSNLSSELESHYCVIGWWI